MGESICRQLTAIIVEEVLLLQLDLDARICRSEGSSPGQEIDVIDDCHIFLCCSLWKDHVGSR